jgi:hypothetical protein
LIDDASRPIGNRHGAAALPGRAVRIREITLPPDDAAVSGRRGCGVVAFQHRFSRIKGTYYPVGDGAAAVSPASSPVRMKDTITDTIHRLVPFCIVCALDP